MQIMIFYFLLATGFLVGMKPPSTPMHYFLFKNNLAPIRHYPFSAPYYQKYLEQLKAMNPAPPQNQSFPSSLSQTPELGNLSLKVEIFLFP